MTMTWEPGGSTGTEPIADTPTGAPTAAVEGRSLGRIAWNRLRKDKLAIVGGIIVILLILIAIFAPLLTSIEGASENGINTNLIDPNLQIPIGGMGGISSQHWLGIDLPEGRDLFSRIAYGARVSLGIAFLSTLLALVIGVVLGMVAGYFGGWIDSVISRTMDVMLAFPVLLFAISLSDVLSGTNAFGLNGNSLHFVLLVFVIGFFSWPYIGRIIRGQVIGLKEREFIDAARSLGAKPSRILFKEILPNLVAPILIYATLLIPTNILFEAALSFLGVGMKDPTPSWGQMIDQAVNNGLFQVDPEFLIVPGVAIFLTVLAFNLLGDGLRDALDPKASR
ncbi:ABC transporter permease [Actinospica sp. MGRD01-02]|uniref:ABC transporter permease n=1 Tax=Actinospica acidithermotolerans TaxID=2828514 RepID=A0A941EAS4_9ACTN|nr:ABC transporter permease [Actinospica acidithermotolerans]MBR7826840.1 ABC transporter permease [Actinospica acidithermotolerans]